MKERQQSIIQILAGLAVYSVTILWIFAVSILAVMQSPVHADEQVPLIMQSDWDHIQSDVTHSVVPTMVLIDNPRDLSTGTLRVRLQEALRNNASYVNVFEVPTTSPEDPSQGYPQVFEVPTILFVGHSGNSLTLLNAATGFHADETPLEPAELSDFVAKGLQNLSAPPVAGKTITVSQAQVAADPSLASGRKIIYLLGESTSWLRVLEEQVFMAVSNTDTNHLFFVIVSGSHQDDGPLCNVTISSPDPAHPGKRLDSSAPGFLTDQQMRNFIRISTHP